MNKGRPCILGDRPMTSAERSRRARAKRRAGAQQLDEHRRWKAGWDALSDKEKSERVLADICLRHNLRTDTDRVVAMKAVAALGKDSLLYAKLIELLPPPINADVSSPVVTPSAARERLLELVLNACAADRFEAEQIEQSEVTALRAEVAELRRRLGEQPNGKYTFLLPPEGEPKAITPSIGDITPPGERTDVGVAPPKYDPPPKPPPVIDATPTPTAPPSPTQAGRWDESASGKAWHEWRERNPHLVDYL
jgi:hypothetical protein